MKIGLVSDCLAGRSFEELLKTCKELGIEQVELGVGNWSSAPHVDLDALLESETRRDEMKGMLWDYGISISAFNCSGNPLAPGDWGKREDEVTRKCFRLSEYFGLDTVVMMSGLPGGGPEDKYPNWVVTSWPPETQTILDYQWNQVAIPYWKELVKVANSHGVTKLALEPHGCQLVHDVENFYRLRDACGGDKTIGFNLDPSHLFWMGLTRLPWRGRWGMPFIMYMSRMCVWKSRRRSIPCWTASMCWNLPSGRGISPFRAMATTNAGGVNFW